MPIHTKTLNGVRLEVLLTRFLQYGTRISSAIIALGLALMSIEFYRGAAVSRGVSGTTWVAAGIAVLIMLPILRLALMLIAFLRERDYVFVMITASVLTIIVLGTALGFYLPAHGH